MGKKSSRDPAPAPARNHLFNYFDKQQKPRADGQQHQDPARLLEDGAIRENPVLRSPAKGAAAAALPGAVLPRAADLDADFLNSSQVVEWADPARDFGDGVATLAGDVAPPQQQAAAFKQRLMQAQRQPPRVDNPLATADEVLEEALAGLGAAPAVAARRTSCGSPGAGGPLRTPMGPHRPAGIIRGAPGSRLGGARGTPASVAFKVPPGHVSARARHGVTTTKKRKHSSIVKALNEIVECISGQEGGAGGGDAPAVAAPPAQPVGLAVGEREQQRQRVREPVKQNDDQLTEMDAPEEQETVNQGATQPRPTGPSPGAERSQRPAEVQVAPPPQPLAPLQRQATPGTRQESNLQAGAHPPQQAQQQAPAGLGEGTPVRLAAQGQAQDPPASPYVGTRPGAADGPQAARPVAEAGQNGLLRAFDGKTTDWGADSATVGGSGGGGSGGGSDGRNCPAAHAQAQQQPAQAAAAPAAQPAQQAHHHQQQAHHQRQGAAPAHNPAAPAAQQLAAAGPQSQHPLPSQSQSQQEPVPAAPARLAGDRLSTHHTVTGVWAGLDAGPGIGTETILELTNPYTNEKLYSHLRGAWAIDSDFRVGDPVNVLVSQRDPYEGRVHCRVGGPGANPRDMLVHFPDLLLGGTRVAGSTSCHRQGYLEERAPGTGGSNAACLKGTMGHALFQAALTQGLRTGAALEARARALAESAPSALLDANMTEHELYAALKDSIPRILSVLNKFQRQEPTPNAQLSAGVIEGTEVRRLGAVTEIIDIEEYIAAPKHGLKGFVDASVRLALRPVPPGRFVTPRAAPFRGSAAAALPQGAELVVAPLELKTGRERDSDAAQVLLYLLAMEERYGVPLNWGLLINLNPRADAPARLIARQDALLGSLMIARNRLAAALARAELPPLAYAKSGCVRCFARSTCMLTHAAVEAPAGGGAAAGAAAFCEGLPNGTDRTALAAAYESETAHLGADDLEFLRRWNALLDAEAGASANARPEIWALSGAEREAAGRCITGLTIVSIESRGPEGPWMYTFARGAAAGGAPIPAAFPPGEMLMLGVDGLHAGVGRGHLYACTPETVTVVMDKALRPELLWPSSRPAFPAAAPTLCDPSVSWRLDKEEVGTTVPRMRSFLYALFERSTDAAGAETPEASRAAKLRRLVVRREAPAPPPPFPQLDPLLATAVETQVRLLNLNTEQAAAVAAAVGARDYALVLGMPGAGKTTAVVAILRALAAAGRRVLLTSYTNSAVDNVLLKLAATGDGDVPFVRVGREGRMHPDLAEWTPGGARYNAQTAGELAHLVDSVKIWGCSALGVADPLIRRREFDVCVVDEAGQITLPATLGPLLRARAFVLVGDPHQLPPLVTSADAAEGGLDKPLFAALAEAHPQTVHTLPVQYRMAEDIQALPNLLTYGGRLRCGSAGVARAALALPRWPPPPATPTWVAATLDPARRVVFLDTGGAPAPEARAGDAVSNPAEAEAALALLTAAVATGLPAASIGVISPYNRQVALLGRLAGAAGVGAAEALTIDRAQGRDKDMVIVSFVRSNAQREAGRLLADARRVNVALTRAKAKLVLIGDGATLATLPMFNTMLGECQRRGWIYQLPRGVLGHGQVQVQGDW